MTASTGVVTEMVQFWALLSSTAALHPFRSPKEEIGNMAWVLLALEGCSPKIAQKQVDRLDFQVTAQSNKSRYYKDGGDAN